MLEWIRFALARAINSVYYFMTETLGLKFLDIPITYALITVAGLALIPLMVRSTYRIYANPHEYGDVPLTRVILRDTAIVLFLTTFGYINYLRTLAPA